MEIRRVEVGTEEYAECLELRRVILRVPLGLEWSVADLAQEDEDWHMGIWDGGELAGCVSLRWLEAGTVKLRQMAVAADRQGSGVGQALVGEVLEMLREEGARRVELHSRETAVGFYERLGFEVEGERFEEVGLPHWKMLREI